MDDKFLINTLIIMACIKSKQPGAMLLEHNPLFVAASRLKELDALKAQVERLQNYIEDAQGRQSKSCGLMTDKQLDILKSELIPLFLKSCTPILEKVIKKRLELFADEVANQLRQQARGSD